MDLRVKLIDEWAKLPEKAGPDEAGFDLFASWPATVRRGTVARVRTGVCVEIPGDHFGLICDRSGLGSRGFTVLGGVVDPSYRGELIVLLASVAVTSDQLARNYTAFEALLAAIAEAADKRVSEDLFYKEEEKQIEAGDKIAQLVLLPKPYFRVLQVESLPASMRGSRGFGSTDTLKQGA